MANLGGTCSKDGTEYLSPVSTRLEPGVRGREGRRRGSQGLRFTVEVELQVMMMRQDRSLACQGRFSPHWLGVRPSGHASFLSDTPTNLNIVYALVPYIFYLLCALSSS